MSTGPRTPEGRARLAALLKARRAKQRAGSTGQLPNAILDTISARLEQQYPADNKDWGALVVRLHDDLVGDARLSLLVLLGAVALVLLIACANLANLLLVRTHARAKEIALRGALGASRLRVVQQLLAEGILLGVGGGIAGFVAASYGVGALVAIFGAALPRAQEVAVDARVLAFTGGISISHWAARGLLSRLAVERPGCQRGTQAGRRAAAVPPAATAAFDSCWSCPR